MTDDAITRAFADGYAAGKAEGISVERERTIAVIKDHYKVAPKAANPLLKLLEVKP